VTITAPTSANAATAGFSSDLVPAQAVVLHGALGAATLNAAIDDCVIERTITGASTLTITVEDPTRALMRSPVLATAVVCTVAGLGFTLVEISKSGNTLTLTFEDSIVAFLRASQPPGSGPGTTAAIAFASALGTLTRSQFATRVWKSVWQATPNPPPIYVWPNAAPLQEILTWGTTANPTEDAWTCLVRLANEVQWRCFSDGTALWFGPDTWLLQRPLAATVVEHEGGVTDIDFDWDIGKTQATAQFGCVCDVVAFPPGAPVALDNMGVAQGTWLVQDMSRSLFIVDATVQLVQAQPALAEPLLTGTPSLITNTTGTAIGGTSSTGSAAAQQAITYALAQVGKPYIWGGIGPTGYDCSGLVMEAYLSAGVTIPRTSQQQWAQRTNNVSLDALEPGDLVFYQGSDGTATSPGHVVMYVGSGNVVEAAHTGTNILVTPLFGGAIGATRPAP
jgi:NlpC/P60 family